MLNDLVNPTTNASPNSTIAKVARRLLVAVSLIIGVGLAGVVFARGKAEQRPSIAWVRGHAVVVSHPVSQGQQIDKPSAVVNMVATEDRAGAESFRDTEAQLAKATIGAEPVAKPQAAIPAAVATKRVIMMEVTAYCPCTKCCGPKAQGITASGKPVSYNDGRFVAADTKKLPFGTKLSIPGYGDGRAVEVIDRGGAIKGDKLDVYFPTHAEALRWGRQKVAVTVED